MSQYSIVVTTINQPTDDIKDIVRLSEATQIIAIGDKKTPADWSYEGVRFVPFAEQEELYPELCEYLPANHYSRKNIGYLMAATSEYIYETDDDNRPIADMFGVPQLYHYLRVTNTGWINVMPEFGDGKIWPRGFPLELVNTPEPVHYTIDKIEQPVVMGLVDQDPDVDAIYRMTGSLPYHFRPGYKNLILTGSAWFPWNSQNTWWRNECLPLMYLPTAVTPRVTDILRSYVATAILQKFGKGVGITSPTAVQVRNQHNLLRDFADEIPLYLNANKMMQVIQESIVTAVDYYDAMHKAYIGLYRSQLVGDGELSCLLAFLRYAKEIERSKL